MKKDSRKYNIYHGVMAGGRWVLFAIVSFIILFPVYWIFISSITPSGELFKTPIDYLNYYRIESAAEELSASYKSVTDIALSCGFNDLSYFNRLFKRQKNMTPTAYRKKSRWVLY